MSTESASSITIVNAMTIDTAVTEWEFASSSYKKCALINYWASTFLEILVLFSVCISYIVSHLKDLIQLEILRAGAIL